MSRLVDPGFEVSNKQHIIQSVLVEITPLQSNLPQQGYDGKWKKSYVHLPPSTNTYFFGCAEKVHFARSRATIPRAKGNAWTAKTFSERRFYKSQGSLGSITSENIYRKTLQLPETAQNKGGVHFQDEKKLEFGCLSGSQNMHYLITCANTIYCTARSRARFVNFTRASIGRDNYSLGDYLPN